MRYEYDIVVIGLGPAGMAVSIMGSAMGLKVCAIEKKHIGGECMNVGCIPSKALLEAAKYRHAPSRFGLYGLGSGNTPEVIDAFQKIQKHLSFISEKKTMGMFKKVDLIYQKGAAEFVDSHSVRVGDKVVSGKRIFIAVGTRPQILPVPGIEDAEPLTNETIFNVDSVPPRLIVLGGGAIACEMAQAFCRLGSDVTVVQRSKHILSRGEPDAAVLLEKSLREEGVNLLTGRLAKKIEKQGDEVILHTDKGDVVRGDKLLAASGRELSYSELRLDKAGIGQAESGAISVNKHLQTSVRHIYAVGDCNGYKLLTHSAMHQGMIALINSMTPWPFKRDYRKYVVPYTVFTDPQISHTGLHEKELKDRGIRYETVETRYEDYGAAIAENIGRGFVRAYVSPTGRIYGASIVGEASGELINEWSLAIQKKAKIYDIMMLQHSFPTMGFMTKRVGETWMMNKMKSVRLQKLVTKWFRLVR